MVPDSAELDGFVASWVMAASDASGQCTKLCAQLEPLQSQDQLIGLITAASEGIGDHRKRLTALGPNPSTTDVQAFASKCSLSCYIRSFLKMSW